MRLFIGCIAVFACAFFFSTPVAADDRPFMQNHTIEIEVECIQAATEIIRELNGYNLDSTIFVHEQQGRTPQRRAEFTRRVERWAFRQVQEVLRSMGDVISEAERATYLGPQIRSVDAQLAAISQEIDRLTVLMAASTTLNHLLTIESRLTQVTWERNSLIGRRNVLVSQATSPVIIIRLFEIQDEIEVQEPIPLTFGNRVSGSFGESWYNTRTSAADLLVFIVRISVPLLAFMVAAGFAGFVFIHVRKNRRERAATTAPVVVAPIEVSIKEVEEE